LIQNASDGGGYEALAVSDSNNDAHQRIAQDVLTIDTLRGEAGFITAI
jgi:hypothetical protein